MPPRRRRDGYRQGQLSEDLRTAIVDEIARLEAIEDPVQTIKEANDAFAGLDDVVDDLAVPRLRAVIQLREQGWTLQRIGTETGLSKMRVQQLAADAKRRGLKP